MTSFGASQSGRRSPCQPISGRGNCSTVGSGAAKLRLSALLDSINPEAAFDAGRRTLGIHFDVKLGEMIC